MEENEQIPDPGPVYVLKNDEKRGPFFMDEIFDLLESGELKYEDVCLREGATECERLRDILDWEEEESQSNASNELSHVEPEKLEQPKEEDDDDDAMMMMKRNLHGKSRLRFRQRVIPRKFCIAVSRR